MFRLHRSFRDRWGNRSALDQDWSASPQERKLITCVIENVRMHFIPVLLVSKRISVARFTVFSNSDFWMPMTMMVLAKNCLKVTPTKWRLRSGTPSFMLLSGLRSRRTCRCSTVYRRCQPLSHVAPDRSGFPVRPRSATSPNWNRDRRCPRLQDLVISFSASAVNCRKIPRS